jgi:hypothetical protein
MGNKKGKALKTLDKSNSFYEKGEKISAPKVISKGKAKNLPTKPKILILCEGQTEVNYFKGITKSETYKTTAVHTAIVEAPESNQAKNLMLLAVSILLEKTTANNKARLNAFFEQGLPAEEERKTKTKNYYNEKAERLLEDGTFDQIWLVFDNDDNEGIGNEARAALFGQAQNFGINIAYSNRQFENWILLHFEQNATAFLASECKNALEGTLQNRRKFSKNCRCGFSDFSHKSCVGTDCKGTICIGGYLRENKLHPCYLKGDWRKKGQVSTPKREYCYEGLFDATVTDFLNVTQAQERIVFDKIRTAITNAEWLRQKSGNPTPETAANPYTNVDLLVKILIQ